MAPLEPNCAQISTPHDARSNIWYPVPGLKLHPHVLTASTRRPFNFGIHVGDAQLAAVNRAELPAKLLALARASGHQPELSTPDIVWLKQVHGNQVFDADDDLLASEPEADAALTTRTDRVLAIMTADCLPVLLADRDTQVLGAAHVGWRGLLLGVLENIVAQMRTRQTSPSAIDAVFGPAIGPADFEVGQEVREAFLAQSREFLTCFVPVPQSAGKTDRWLCDLYRLSALRLQSLGVQVLNQEAIRQVSTVSDRFQLFSHRADQRFQGLQGRQVTLIWRLPSV